MATEKQISAFIDAIRDSGVAYVEDAGDGEFIIDGVVNVGAAIDAAAPAEEEIDAGRFEQWTIADFAGQCRMQARDNLDPEYSQFMAALAARLSAFAAMPGDDRFKELKAAFLRGANWVRTNGGTDLVEKAAYDYADYETSPITAAERAALERKS